MVTVSSTPVAIGSYPTNTDPMLQVYPNPTTNRLSYHFRLVQSSQTAITIYNCGGEPIHFDPIGFLNPGIHSGNFLLNDITAGLYIIRLQTDNQMFFQKIIYNGE